MLALVSIAAAAVAACAGLLLALAPWSAANAGLRPGGPQAPSPPWAWRLAWPWIRLLAGPAHRLLGWRRRAALEDVIQRAGCNGWLAPADLAAAQLLAALLAGGLLGGLADAAGWGLAGGLWLAGAGAAGAAMLPTAWLADQRRARARRMGRDLPFLLDMITLCMEAGLNVQAALQQAVERGPAGPLRDAFQGALSEVRTGVSRLEALRALAARSGLPAMQTLVSAMAQAEALGMSLAPVLRAQSERLRAERLLRAEQLALEAPVKMLVPLILCIFPCTFLVLGFPIGYRLLQASW